MCLLGKGFCLLGLGEPHRASWACLAALSHTAQSYSRARLKPIGIQVRPRKGILGLCLRASGSSGMGFFGPVG